MIDYILLMQALLCIVPLDHVSHIEVYDVIQAADHYAQQHSNDIFETVAIIYHESRFNKDAKSSAKACGLMQVSDNWSAFSCDELQQSVDINLFEGGRMMADFKRVYGKNWICHYNAGNECNEQSVKWANAVKYFAKRLRSSYLRELRQCIRYL